MGGESLDEPLIKKRAPTLYGIIAFKLAKGALLLTLAIVAYSLSDNNLPEEYQGFLRYIQPVLELVRVHPANKFFTHIAEQIGSLTEAKVLWAAAGTLFYSLFSLVEGVGLMFRISWAGWLAIGESAFFVPIEIYELSRRSKFSWWLLAVLVINVFIVCYLFKNRHRLFVHHHHAAPVGEGDKQIRS